MKTTQYLYGINPEEFKDLNYVDAIVYKIRAAHKLIHHLMYDFHYAERDDTRGNKVQDAIKFNEGLLRELGKTYKDFK